MESSVKDKLVRSNFSKVTFWDFLFRRENLIKKSEAYTFSRIIIDKGTEPWSQVNSSFGVEVGRINYARHYVTYQCRCEETNSEWIEKEYLS